jgi:hypothetical protein
LPFRLSNLTRTGLSSKLVINGKRPKINHLSHRMDSEGRTSDDKGISYLEQQSGRNNKSTQFTE